MKKLWWLIIPILIFAIWIFQKNNFSNDQKEHVVIAQTGDFFLYAPVYVAIDAGFFSRQGLDVTIVSTGGDEKTWAAVLSGDAMFGISDPTFIAISDQHGKPGKIIASIVNGVPFWGITFRNDIQTISEPRLLRPYSVATFPAPSTAFALQKKMFSDGGLHANIHEGAFGTIIPMLKAEKADIGLELEPNVSQAEMNGAKVVYSLAEIYKDFSITGLTVNPKTISEHPSTVKKVVNGLQMALSFIRTNQDSAISILHKRFPEIQLQIARTALTRVVKEGIIPSNCLISDSAWYKAVKLRYDNNDIKEIKPMDVYVDNSFAKESSNSIKK